MVEPSTAQIGEPTFDFDAETASTPQIVQWLRAGLDAFFEDDAGRWAFEPLQFHIGRCDDLASDLSAVHDSLTVYAKSRWRLATRDLLTIHSTDESKREQVQVLMNLAALIRATGVMDVLPDVVTAHEGDDGLFDTAVHVALALTQRTSQSRECLERIHASPAFKADYAGLVLVALCHADPDDWTRHVSELAEPMKWLAETLPAESTALRFYAKNIHDSIGVDRITETALDGLPHWLRGQWLEGDDPLLIATGAP